MDLDMLEKYATEGEGMPISDALRGQCIVFADYIRRVKWHFSACSEVAAIADRFEAIAHREGVRS